MLANPAYANVLRTLQAVVRTWVARIACRAANIRTQVGGATARDKSVPCAVGIPFDVAAEWVALADGFAARGI